MYKILLTKAPDEISLDLQGKSICVYHKVYTPPNIKGCDYIIFDKFKADPRFYLQGIKHLLFVGMNRAINPGNRTKMVFEVLHNNTPNLHKISIDYTLFVSEPWRIWFHFGYASASYLIYTYSYLAQSHYNFYCEGLIKENPFSIENISNCGKGVVKSYYQNYFDDINIKMLSLSVQMHADYQKLKKKCFDEETSIKRIIARLSKFAQDACPSRKVPSSSSLFSMPSPLLGDVPCNITHTDLGVDLYLVKELKKLISLTNDISTKFYEGNNVCRIQK